MKRTEIFFFILIIVIAAGMRLYGLDSIPAGLHPHEARIGNEAVRAWGNFDRVGLFAAFAAVPIHFFGNTAFALRFTSALAGILTVVGVYFLTRRLFDNWKLSSLCAFLMAVGFWHIVFSRTASPEILAPLFAVWTLLYLLIGIRSHRLWHWGVSGFLLGVGIYTSATFLWMPLATIAILFAHWLAVRSSFQHEKYIYTRKQFLGNFSMLIGIALVTILLLAQRFAVPIAEGALAWPIINLAGQSMLFWPVAAFFAVGLLHTIWRLFQSWHHRGHPGIPQTLILSWLACGFVPPIVASGNLPDTTTMMVISPAIYIVAGIGLYWLFSQLEHWYALRDTHQVCLFNHRHCTSESALVSTLTLVIVLLALGIADGDRYFRQWTHDEATASAFAYASSDAAYRIRQLPLATLKYVVIDTDGPLVSGVPLSTQSIIYLTDTATPALQSSKHVVYVLPHQLARTNIPRGAFVVHITQ